ncbi:MAG: response regulator transcription factor [Candidatus Neomarinimicrobiota bacterium]
MKVLVVDDSDMLRERLISLLTDLPDIEVSGQAVDVGDALTKLTELQPDLVILDIRMPGGSGIDVLKSAKLADNPPAVIVFTNYPHSQYRTTCLQEGADYFLEKTGDFDKIPAAIREISNSIISGRC